MSQKTNPNPAPRKPRSLLPSFAGKPKSNLPVTGNITDGSALVETGVSVLSTDSTVEGDLTLSATARIHGKVKGHIHGRPGSFLVIAESALIEGSIQGDQIVIDGFVRGDIEATGKISISSSGRVIGNLKAPALEIDFGGTFEGVSAMPAAVSSSGATT